MQLAKFIYFYEFFFCFSMIFLEDLRPIAEFNTNYEKRFIEVQPNAVRRLNESLIKERGHQVNLLCGMEKFSELIEFKNKLFPMLCFLKISEQTYGKQSTPEIGDIICNREVLVQLASSAYKGEKYGDDKFDDGFLLVLFKRNQRYYCCEYDTPSKNAKTSLRSSGLYTGIKFENYMTLSQKQSGPDLKSVASSQMSYHAVFKSTLVDKTNDVTHSFLYPAKVDSVDKNGQYVEIKLRNRAVGQGKSWWRIELNWFLEAYFTDIQRIIVGYSNGRGGINDVQEISSDDLNFGRGVYWKLDECLEYLSKFFSDAKKQLDEGAENTYFYAVRQPNSPNYVLTTYAS